MSPGLLRQGDHARRYKDTEDFAEASADQPGQLERPHSRPADLEAGSENRRSDLWSQLNHHRRSQTRDSQIPNAPTSQRHGSTTPDMPTLPVDVSGTDWSYQPKPTASTTNSSTTATISVIDTGTTDFSCPHCPHTLTSRTGLFYMLYVPTCPRCQRTLRAEIGLAGHLRINWASRTAPTIVPPPASSSSSPPPTNPDNSSDPPLPSSSSSSSSSSPTAPTAAAQATVPRTATELPPPPPTPGMRIRTTPALTATVHSPHTSVWSVTCESIAQSLANQRRMGLFGHMRIHESGLDRTPTHSLHPTHPPCTPPLSFHPSATPPPPPPL
nr:unnamed protein product [Spirometra erinaceieuropaei]